MADFPMTSPLSELSDSEHDAVTGGCSLSIRQNASGGDSIAVGGNGGLMAVSSTSLATNANGAGGAATSGAGGAGGTNEIIVLLFHQEAEVALFV
jgi:hypothetical protein